MPRTEVCYRLPSPNKITKGKKWGVFCKNREETGRVGIIKMKPEPR